MNLALACLASQLILNVLCGNVEGGGGDKRYVIHFITGAIDVDYDNKASYRYILYDEAFA